MSLQKEELTVEQKIAKRHLSNKEIIEILSAEVDRDPHVRFGQLLRNMDVIAEYRDKNGTPLYWYNAFNVESLDMLERIKESPVYQRRLKENDTTD